MQKFSLGAKVLFRRKQIEFSTRVVGYDREDGQYIILIPEDEKRCNSFAISNNIKDRYEVIILPDYLGFKCGWALEFEITNLIDGESCLRCNDFSFMAESNIQKNDEKRFACYSCRDTEKWWFVANGWEFNG